MRLVLALASIIAGTAFAGAAHAVDVFKWKDSKGVVHYGDRPASGAAATVVNARDDRADPEDVERAKQRLSDAQDGSDAFTDDTDDEPRPRDTRPRARPPRPIAPPPGTATQRRRPASTRTAPPAARA